MINPLKEKTTLGGKTLYGFLFCFILLAAAAIYYSSQLPESNFVDANKTKFEPENYEGKLPESDNQLSAAKGDEQPIGISSSSDITDDTFSSTDVPQNIQDALEIKIYKPAYPNHNFEFEYPASQKYTGYPIPGDEDWNINYPSYTAIFFEDNFEINVIRGFSSVEEFLEWGPAGNKDPHYENIVDRESIIIDGRSGIKETVYILLSGEKTINHLAYYVYYSDRIYEFEPVLQKLPQSNENLETLLKTFRFLE